MKETNRLLQDRANLSARNEDGESTLNKASSRKHNSVAKLLFDNWATTDYTGFLVQRLLHIAVETGNVKLVELLLNHGVDVYELTAHSSVLSEAISAGREDITSLLLCRDADIDLARYSIQAPLGNAILQKNEHLIKDLLKLGTETDVLLNSLYQTTTKVLSESCRCLLRDWRAQRYEEQVKLIRSPSSDISEKENALVAALTCASKHHQPEIHSMFIELAEELNIARTKEYVYRS